MYRNNIGKREVKSMYEIQKKEKKHYVHFVYYFIDESESTVAKRERKKNCNLCDDFFDRWMREMLIV